MVSQDNAFTAANYEQEIDINAVSDLQRNNTTFHSLGCQDSSTDSSGKADWGSKDLPHTFNAFQKFVGFGRLVDSPHFEKGKYRITKRFI